MRDPLDKALDLVPVPVGEPKTLPVKAQDDYEFARENIRGTLLKADSALDELLLIAQVSQHARAYEVIATLVKTVVEGNRDLVALKKTQQDIRERDGPTTINNNLYISSAEMLDAIKKKFVES